MDEWKRVLRDDSPLLVRPMRGVFREQRLIGHVKDFIPAVTGFGHNDGPALPRMDRLRAREPIRLMDDGREVPQDGVVVELGGKPGMCGVPGKDFDSAHLLSPFW